MGVSIERRRACSTTVKPSSRIFTNVKPSQTLADKIGELKIKELRAYAAKELDGKFEVRAFHGQILGNGALPMDVLEVPIKAWVKKQKR